MSLDHWSVVLRVGSSLDDRGVSVVTRWQCVSDATSRPRLMQQHDWCCHPEAVEEDDVEPEVEGVVCGEVVTAGQ